MTTTSFQTDIRTAVEMTGGDSDARLHAPRRMRAIGYVRQAFDELDKKATSPEGQKARIAASADANGWHLVHIYRGHRLVGRGPGPAEPAHTALWPGLRAPDSGSDGPPDDQEEGPGFPSGALGEARHHLCPCNLVVGASGSVHAVVVPPAGQPGLRLARRSSCRE